MNKVRAFSLLLPITLFWIISLQAACQSQSPTTQATINSEALQAQIQADLKGKLTHYIHDYRDQAGTLFVRWDLYGDSSNERIANTAREDTVTILKNLTLSKQPFEKVILSGWYFWTVDINGTLDYNEFIRLEYSPETLAKINWETIRSEYIWLVADGGEIHWLLEE
jgi:hypothetical protein